MKKTIIMPRKYRLRLDHELDQYIPAQQGDIRTRLIHFYLMHSEQTIELSDVKSAECFGMKSDGTKIYNQCIIEDVLQGIVSVELNEQVLAVKGDIKMQLTLRGFSGEILSTSYFYVRVKETMRNEGIESMDQSDILDCLIRETETAITVMRETFAADQLAREQEFIRTQAEKQGVFDGFMSDIEDEWISIVTGGTKELEVVHARNSTVLGQVFETLDARLEHDEEDIKLLKPRVNALVDGQNALDGRTTNLETKTNGLQNKIDNIISGEQGIGNADTLGGHSADYFATAQGMNDLRNGLTNGTIVIKEAETLGGLTPDAFATSYHRHNFADLDGVPEEQQLSWDNITGKPSQFPPASHEHDSSYSPIGHAHQWGDIKGKPSSFTPSAHTHDYLPSGGTAANSTKWGGKTLRAGSGLGGANGYITLTW